MLRVFSVGGKCFTGLQRELHREEHDASSGSGEGFASTRDRVESDRASRVGMADEHRRCLLRVGLDGREQKREEDHSSQHRRTMYHRFFLPNP